ncbi:Zn-dependent alcohol dehydrogenase [Stackebrandtia nassauensis]|uniref:Zinc-binding alcohol dehydrogenase n=1 Tax=Stackebrandtia nassauensis (strain DSM 44728 / CIP 108903 / NRRL B-16338 / NBRC 102104 / LLR-40K-21) TaxID=446470 RepID=D3PZR7_STANL|nr:Zn-dependent alcohol dehydrogenase [Stackebrandtia nassauensis]ADD43604.1 zinc-binding alcohol dehydrogenase [Stackebrandtia nassauensis DSM 44728]
MPVPSGSPIGLHRVLEPVGVLPQAALRLDASPEIRPDEVRIRVERLNLDAASYRQLREAHDGDGAAVRRAVREIIAERGKMHNPVTGSGGMLIGTVEEAGPESPLGLKAGDKVATLVSLTLTPLAIHDELADWDGGSEQVPCDGHAILFARSIAAVLPEDLPDTEALAVFDVCGAPAMTARVVERHRRATGKAPSVAVLGAAGKSGTLSLAAARDRGAGTAVGIVRTAAEAKALAARGLTDEIAVADATDAVAVSAAVLDRLAAADDPGANDMLTDAERRQMITGADITVVCVDVPGCEHGAILSTAEGGTVIFFSMATSFPTAALGAEGLAADVEMLIGNGYTPGHAAYALDLVRSHPGARSAFSARTSAD